MLAKEERDIYEVFTTYRQLLASTAGTIVRMIRLLPATLFHRLVPAVSRSLGIDSGFGLLRNPISLQVRWLAIFSTLLLPIGSFAQLNQFNVSLIKAPVDSRLFLGGGGSLHLNSVSRGVAVGTQTGASGFTQGLVFDVPTQNLIRFLDPVSELWSVATGAGGPVIAGDSIQVNPTIVQSVTHNTCVTDGLFGLPPVPFPIENWTWCTGIDASGNVVGVQYTSLVVNGASDPPTSGFTQVTLNAFVNGTLLGPGRALGVSGNEQVGDINSSSIAPGTPGTNGTAVLWHGSAQSMVPLGTICDATIFLNHNGCDSSSAFATNGSQQGGFSTFGPRPMHATLWSGTAASQTDLHPASFTSSRITGLSTVFQAGDGWMNGDNGTPGALHHGLLWQGTAASAVDLSPILPPDYPYVTITGASPEGEVSGYIEKDLNGAPDPASGVGIVLTPIPSMSVGSLTLNPSNAAPGDTVTATVALRAPAAAGGVPVNITTSDALIVPAPASVLIPEGQTSASVNVPTPAAAFLTAPETVTLTAIAGYTGSTATLTMTPKAPADPIGSISVTTGRVNPGTAALGQITLAAAAPAGGTIVSLNALLQTVTLSLVVDPACQCLDQNITTYSALPAGLISIPASVIVPEGQTTVSFSIATANPLNASPNVIRQVAIQAATGNVMKQAILTVGPPSVLQVIAFEDNFNVPTTNPFPGQSSGNHFGVSLNVPTDAPITVTFTSTNPAIVMPSSVTINPGANGATFFFSTLGAPALTSGIVTATANGVSVSAPVSVAAVPQPVLSSVNIPFVSSGQPFTGTVTLSAGALLGGATITLASDTPGVAAVPASITIPFGSTTGSFTGMAGPVAGPATVTITAAFNGIARTGTLSVLPGPVLSVNFTLSPYAMVGPGVVTTGTISLNQPAPPGGVTVALTSNSSAAKLPATATVAAGQTSASFSVQGNSVSATTPVVLTATYSGGLAPFGPVSAAANLTVAPSDVLKAAVKPTWSTSTHLLTATCTSTNPQAIVTALNANGNVPLGVMTNAGNGNYTFQTTIDSISAVNFKSNLGGSTGQGVTIIP